MAEEAGGEGGKGVVPLLKNSFVRRRRVEPFYTGGAVAVNRAADRVACTCGEGAKIVTMDSGEVLAVIMGDTAPVTAMVWHPSGEQIVVSTQSLQTRFWAMPDLSEAGRAAAPEPDDGGNPDSAFAAGPRCEELHTFKAHDMPVASMCFDTTGALLATGDSMGNVRVWDAVRKYCTHNFHAHRGAVYALGFHPDKSRYQLFSAGQDSRVQVYDLRKKAHVHTFDSHQGAVSSLSFSPCGAFLASGGRDQVVNVWKVSPELGGQVSEILALERIEGVAFVAKPAGGAEPKKKQKKQGKDGRQAAAQLCVVTAGERGLLRSWDAASGKEIVTASEDSDIDVAVVAAPGEPPAAELIALHSFPQRAGSEGGSTTAPGLLAVTVEQNLLVRSSLAPAFPLETVLVGTLDEINDARYCRASNADAASGQEETHLVVATNSNAARVLDIRATDDGAAETGTGRRRSEGCRFLTGHSAIVLCVAVSADGRLVATAGKDRTARMWDLATYECIGECVGHTDSIGAIALSANARIDGDGTGFLITGSADKTLKVWDIPSSKGPKKKRAQQGLSADGLTRAVSRFTAAAHEKDINAVAIAPNSRIVATGSQDRTLKIWSAADGSLQGICRGHKRGIWSVAFSPVDKAVATASGDAAVKIWSVADYTCLKTFDGHDASVLRVQFCSSGMQLLSTGADGLMKLWTIRSDSCVATYDTSEDRVWALALGEDEQQAVTGSADGTLSFWHDSTATASEEQTAAREERLLAEQACSNAIFRKQWKKAITLALQLEQPRRLLAVFTELLDSGPNGADRMNDAVRDIVTADDNDEDDEGEGGGAVAGLAKLLKHARDWNTNSRSSRVAQVLLSSILLAVPPDVLRQVPAIKQLVESILPYSERHFARLERLHKASFLLDYTLRAMKTAVPSDAGLQSTVVMGSAGGYQEASSEGDSVAWIRRKELGSGDDLGDDAYTLDEGEEGEETLVALGDGRAVATKKARGDSSDDEDRTDDPVVERTTKAEEGEEATSEDEESSEDEDEDDAHDGQGEVDASNSDSGEDPVDDPYGAAKARARRHPGVAKHAQDDSLPQTKRRKKSTVTEDEASSATAAPSEPSPRRLRARKKKSGGR